MAVRIQTQICRYLRSAVLALPMVGLWAATDPQKGRSIKGKYLVGRLLGPGGLRLPRPSLCILALRSASPCPSPQLRLSQGPASGPGGKELAYSAHSPFQLANKRHSLGLDSWPEQLSAPSSRSHLNSQKCISGTQGEGQACSSQKRLSLFPGDSATGSALTNASLWNEDEFCLCQTACPLG